MCRTEVCVFPHQNAVPKKVEKKEAEGKKTHMKKPLFIVNTELVLTGFTSISSNSFCMI